MTTIIPKNAGKPFTEQEDATIRALHAQGAKPQDIADQLQRTRPGIVARLEWLGLRPSKVLAKQAATLRGMSR